MCVCVCVCVCTDSLLSPEDEQLIAMGLQDGGNDDKDPGGESFENLFGRLAHMKRKYYHNCTISCIHP